MSWDLALKLGATLPHTVDEHRALLREGRHLRVRVNGPVGAGMAMFWEIAPGIIVRSS
jgi:hypothetical protein